MDSRSKAAEILGLHRAGALPDRYPEVRELLTGLSGAEFAQAGRLLARLDSAEVLRAHPTTPAVTVAITGNATLGALVAPLTAEFARHGLLARARISSFGNYLFDLADQDGELSAAEPDLVLTVLDAAVVFDEVPTPWTPEDVAAVFAEKLDLLEALLPRFGEKTGGALVLNSIPLPPDVASQLLDHRSRARLGAVWRAANERLLRFGEAHPFVIVLDTDTLVAEGIKVRDPRMSVYARAHLTPDLLARYAREVGHLARHLTGRTKKVLAVDLDNTVWGGILGDDGIEGIEVADSYRGEAFRAFQLTLRQLAAQGVLLAAVSKNDVEPVRAALRDHPRITLREDDFVRVVANWRPKHENLTELAADLNVGVDAIVFVDDSPYERGLVERELPEVSVVAVGTEPAWHVEALLHDGWFDTVELTAEDRQRPERYQKELVRKDFLHTFTSIEDYLRELDVTVEVSHADASELARVSQLTLRTNQFNLTTERLQPAEVRALSEDPDAAVLVVKAGDRFGDNGIVGAILTRRAGGLVHVDNFLLSCRVFARGVEQAALAALLTHARDTGATGVVGVYRSTPKNGKVRDFYPGSGFRAGTGPEPGENDTFHHDLLHITPPPDHVRLSAKLERTTA